VSTWQPSGIPPGERPPRRISELLDRTTRRFGAHSSRVTSAVIAGWEGLVGPDIAGHARPVSLRDGVLVLAVDHPAWAAQLRFMTAELLARIEEMTGSEGSCEVAEIQIRVVGQPASSDGWQKRAKRGQ
jgi:predicted nucleic acid-binding Zn ribbon protein